MYTFALLNMQSLENTEKWYTHIPKPVSEDGNVTVLWNQAVLTVREVTANRPEIIIKIKKRKYAN